MWSRHLAGWQKIAQVRRLTVRLLPEDIVSDFYLNVLDAPAPAAPSASVNKSLPATVLRLFQGNPKLRPGPHGSLIDFVLSENLKSAEPAPWVLNSAWISRILEETRAENRRLLTMMDPASAKAMRADPRWWDAAAYAEKEAEPPGPVPLPASKLEALCVDLVGAIEDLARKERPVAGKERSGAVAELRRLMGQ
jgi:hypothetical protein